MRGMASPTLTPALPTEGEWGNFRPSVGVAGVIDNLRGRLCCSLAHRMGEGQGEGKI